MFRTRTGWMMLAVMGVMACSIGSTHADQPVSLFDGKTLEHWDVINCEAVVRDGAIVIEAGNGLVQSKRQYGDFVLECEWKALKDDAWDSGVYFRYQDVPQGSPWPDRYQVNIRKGGEGDLVGFPEGKNKIPIKVGEWNRFELTVRGSVVSLKVNGQPAWKVDGITAARGYLALQAEVPGGGQFLFRNLRITEL